MCLIWAWAGHKLKEEEREASADAKHLQVQMRNIAEKPGVTNHMSISGSWSFGQGKHIASQSFSADRPTISSKCLRCLAACLRDWRTKARLRSDLHKNQDSLNTSPPSVSSFKRLRSVVFSRAPLIIYIYTCFSDRVRSKAYYKKPTWIILSGCRRSLSRGG